MSKSASRSTAAAIGLTLSLSVAACGSFRPDARPFVGPGGAKGASPNLTAARANSWAEILEQPGKIELTTFDTGRVRVMRSDLVDFDDPQSKSLKEEQLFVPVFAHLLHHDNFGDVLVDAGLDRSFLKITSGDMRGMFAYKFYALQNVAEDALSQLKSRNANVRAVFFTHLHPDHLSGAASMPRDLKYVVGKGEAPTSHGFLFYEDALSDIRDFEELDFDKAPVMAPLGPCIDVLGDGSFWAISTPGHTSGHVSYLAITKSGAVLLTGDVSHTRWGFEHGVMPGKFNDGKKEDSRKSLDQLIAFSKMYPKVRVIFGHEQ